MSSKILSLILNPLMKCIKMECVALDGFNISDNLFKIISPTGKAARSFAQKKIVTFFGSILQYCTVHG